MVLRLPLSKLYQIGAKLSELCLVHDISYALTGSNTVKIKGQRKLNFFKAQGPCHRLLVEHGAPVAEFLSRPSLHDPRNLLISPKLVLGVVQIARVYANEVERGRKAGQPPVACYHWAKGEEDWAGTQCPLPYTMVREATLLD